MLMKGVTLRGLEVFEALAASGTVAQASEATGLSQPAVSQQLRNLETALGVDLVDHGKRPMRLTPAGRSFLTRTEAVLAQLRLAQSELTVMDLSHLDTLSIGLIDDFDNDLTPRLVTILAESLTECRFKMITAPSLHINDAVRAGDLHLAIAASTEDPHPAVVEDPLVRDPFMLVVPRGALSGGGAKTGDTVLAELAGLPFLRYSDDQLISRQIEAHLGAALPPQVRDARFEIGSHLALMAMVARRIGWAVTTPLGYMRAERFHDQIDAHPLPGPGFARQISLFAGADWSDAVPRDVAATVRRLVQSHMIDPAVARLPWLAGELRVIGE